jgi:glycine/D-amino acid oxidase-like deaminating enzyme
MRAKGLQCLYIDGPELRRRYPVYADPTLSTTLVEPQAGAILAADAVLALRDLARSHGVAIHEGKRAVRLHPQAGACAVEFADGSSVEADTVVLAVNGWTATLLPNLDDRLRPRQPGADGRIARGLHNTEQPVYHVVPRADAFDQFLPERFPIAGFMNRRVNIFPAAKGTVKVASDDGSRHIGLPEERQLASVEYREELFAFAEAQVPALRGAALVQERACFYDRSPDDHFIMDQWDPDTRLIVACGFSGHGFKFGPLLGDRLARYALTARRPADLHHFSFARFAQGTPEPSEDAPMP